MQMGFSSHYVFLNVIEFVSEGCQFGNCQARQLLWAFLGLRRRRHHITMTKVVVVSPGLSAFHCQESRCRKVFLKKENIPNILNVCFLE